MDLPHIRKAKINYLLTQLNDGKRVTDQAIQSVLTEQEWQELAKEIDQWKIKCQPRAKPYGRMPSELERYADLIKAADCLFSRAKACRDKTYPRSVGFMLPPMHLRGLTAKELRYCEAENAYDDALEKLAEMLSDEPGLAIWLDRPARFGQNDGTVSANPDGVPRLITSRSVHARHYSPGKPTKSSLQKWALQSSLNRFDLFLSLEPPPIPQRYAAKVRRTPDLDDGW
ncbi:MAG: hypothetical protein H6R18_276 [Proteobacteria bacterium]|nr:hypothetical protein [Pseudomonadota bacterium]